MRRLRRRGFGDRRVGRGVAGECRQRRAIARQLTQQQCADDRIGFAQTFRELRAIDGRQHACLHGGGGGAAARIVEHCHLAHQRARTQIAEDDFVTLALRGDAQDAGFDHEGRRRLVAFAKKVFARLQLDTVGRDMVSSSPMPEGGNL